MNNNARIISISGNPVSGKSTVVKKMIEKLKERGFSDENIHLVSTGTMFRECFNKVMNLISSIDNEEKMNEYKKDKDIRKILKNPTYRKKIRDLCISLKQSGIDPKEYDIANANTSQELGSVRHIIDEIVDSEITELGKQIIEKNNPDEVWLIDSRLAFHNIPESFAVRLTVRDDVAAKRLLDDNTRGDEDNNYQSFEEAKNKVIERKQGEQERYKRRYGIDLEDEENYNIIIDTSYSDVDEIADTILICLEHDRDGKEYAKKWASPKVFIPTQSIRDTCGMSWSTKMRFKDIENSIKNEGYDQSQPIEIVEADGIFYLMEGHHRNFASAKAGKTLIPYKKYERYSEEQAKKIATNTRLVYLYDHEGAFDQTNDDGTRISFSYKDIYPNIYKILGRPETPDPQEL